MNLLTKLKQNLFDDLCLDNKNFIKILWQCGVIAVILFFSLLWTPLIYVALAITAVFVCFQFDGKQLYFLIFVLPFMNIFKKGVNTTYFMSYIALLIAAILGIKFIINLFKKKTKLNLPLTIICGLFMIYIAFNCHLNSLSTVLGLYCGIVITYIAYVYRKDLNFKHIVILFTFAVLFNAFSGLFLNCFDRLQYLVPVYSANGLDRFAGTTANPNMFSFECLFCLSLNFCLFIKQQSKILFWPISFALISFILCSIGKTAYIILTFELVAFVVIYLIINHKKKDWIIIGSFILMVAVCFLIFNKQVLASFGRFQTSKHSTSTNTTPKPKTLETKLNALTTDRFQIWLDYLTATFTSLKTALFGYGVGAPLINDLPTHNTFLYILYDLGIVGLLFFIGIIASIFDFKQIKKINLFILIPLGCVFLDFMAESFMFVGFMYCIILSFGMFSNKNSETKLKEIKNKG